MPWLLALVFFGPLALATGLYFFGGDEWLPAGRTTHGVLLEPPPLLPAGVITLPGGKLAEFRGHWSLLYVARGDCDDNCRDGLYRTRQVRRALGREMGRVQRFFVVTGGVPNLNFLAADHPDVLALDENLASRDAVLRALGSYGEGDVFVADPLGNLVIRFPAGTPMKDMHTDVEHLLKASQIG